MGSKKKKKKKKKKKQATLDESMQPLIIKTLGLKVDDEVARIHTAWCKKAP
jgi:hypothetical protein